MDLPLVSCVIPTFDRGELLEGAIASCLDQTYEHIEVIVVDDFPSRPALDVVTRIGSERLKYYKNTSSFGASYSRNRGIALSRGEYLQFLDDDDRIFPEKIERQLDKFLKSDDANLGVVTSDVRYRRNDINKVIENRAQGNVYKELLKENFVRATHSVLIKREKLQGLKWDTTLLSNQEYDFFIQLGKRCNFDFVPEVLCEVNESDNQISFDFKKKLRGTLTLFNKYKADYYGEGLPFFSYSLARYTYLVFKYSVGLLFGKRVYSLLK